MVEESDFIKDVPLATMELGELSLLLRNLVSEFASEVKIDP